MSHILADLKAFLDASPTSWHTVREMGNRLATRDFIPLKADEKWHLEPGKKYFTEHGGAFCAFCVPEKRPEKAIILAAHTDSPSLKLKPKPTTYKENLAQFGVEVYSSPLLTSWLNRDLALAGRVVITNPSGYVEERLVHLDDAILFIPQLAVHLDRDIHEKGVLLNKQEHLSPIVEITDQKGEPLTALEKILRRHLSFEQLLSFELFLVPIEPARFVGFDHEMLASYRLDNLSNVHAVLSALGTTANKASSKTLQMVVFWDNEEIGSRSADGAASPFLSDLLQRISLNLGLSQEEHFILKNHSFCVSTDMTHALNPNYVSKYDPQHQVHLKKGIVIKSNADQKYASNARSSAVIVRACQMLGLSYQHFVSRSDIHSGSTVGPIVAGVTGITTVDIGIAELSMHSIREVMACQDYLDMYRLLTYLLQEA